jgi:hypothetical protein
MARHQDRGKGHDITAKVKIALHNDKLTKGRDIRMTAW